MRFYSGSRASNSTAESSAPSASLEARSAGLPTSLHRTFPQMRFLGRFPDRTIASQRRPTASTSSAYARASVSNRPNILASTFRCTYTDCCTVSLDLSYSLVHVIRSERSHCGVTSGVPMTVHLSNDQRSPDTPLRESQSGCKTHEPHRALGIAGFRGLTKPLPLSLDRNPAHSGTAQPAPLACPG